LAGREELDGERETFPETVSGAKFLLQHLIEVQQHCLALAKNGGVELGHGPVFNLIAERYEELEVFADRIFGIRLVILREALRQFPVLEVTIDLYEAAMLFAEGLTLLFVKDGVEESGPRNDHEGYVAAGLKLHGGLIINFNGEQG
jgi:hypothetical protein